MNAFRGEDKSTSAIDERGAEMVKHVQKNANNGRQAFVTNEIRCRILEIGATV